MCTITLKLFMEALVKTEIELIFHWNSLEVRLYLFFSSFGYEMDGEYLSSRKVISKETFSSSYHPTTPKFKIKPLGSI